jgi:hypothetical protein
MLVEYLPPTAKVEPAFGEPLPKLPALMLLNPLTDRLTSNAKRVTVAAIEITTGAPEQVSVKILDQHLEGA